MSTKVKLINRLRFRRIGAAALALWMCLTRTVGVLAQETAENPERIMQEDGAKETVKTGMPVKKEYVVVLDPGHDQSHSGASKNGICEEQANLKIAQYCKDALEEYYGVTVYLTHEDLQCPFPGTESTECNKKRCEYAASLGADIFVSLHINNNGSRYVRGYELYYPTANYVPALSSQGYELVKSIERKLADLGMSSHGVYMKDSTENKRNDENFYPDGTRADYYNVIRNCKYNGIPGVIVEHGYLSNGADVNQFLNSDEKLRELGQADAMGIADYLRVHLKTEEEIAAEVEAELAVGDARRKAEEKSGELLNKRVGILSRVDISKKISVEDGKEKKTKIRRLEDVWGSSYPAKNAPLGLQQGTVLKGLTKI